jgi:hypothetical protein
MPIRALVRAQRDAARRNPAMQSCCHGMTSLRVRHIPSDGRITFSN